MPALPALAPVELPTRHAATGPDETTTALRDLVQAWASRSEGRVEVVAVEGSALDAIAAISALRGGAGAGSARRARSNPPRRRRSWRGRARAVARTAVDPVPRPGASARGGRRPRSPGSPTTGRPRRTASVPRSRRWSGSPGTSPSRRPAGGSTSPSSTPIEAAPGPSPRPTPTRRPRARGAEAAQTPRSSGLVVAANGLQPPRRHPRCPLQPSPSRRRRTTKR